MARGRRVAIPVSIESRALVPTGAGSPQLSGAGLHCGGDDHHGALLTSWWWRGSGSAAPWRRCSPPRSQGGAAALKLLPYYGLGIIAMLLCLLFSVAVMAVPWRGSLLLLFLVTSVFLGNALEAPGCSSLP